MMSLTCRDVTPELTRRWLEQQLDRDEQDAVQAHLRGCLTCTRTISKTVSGQLFDFLTGRGRDHVQSFLREVDDLSKGDIPLPEPVPLPPTIQGLVARTRDFLWSLCTPSPIPGVEALGGLGTAMTVSVQHALLATLGKKQSTQSMVLEEEEAKGTTTAATIVLTEAESVDVGPLLTGSGRFHLTLHGPEARLIGKDLCCELQLMDGQMLSLHTSIRAALEGTGWEATFDEPVLTDPALHAVADYQIPFDSHYLRLVVRPAQA